MSHADYQSLIERIADAEPNPCYAHAGQLELTDADVATVLREDYSVLADAVNGDDAETLARRIADMLPAIDERPEYILAGIGAVIVEALRRQARQAIYCDVTAECERREIERETQREALRFGELEAIATVEGL